MSYFLDSAERNRESVFEFGDRVTVEGVRAVVVGRSGLPGLYMVWLQGSATPLPASPRIIKLGWPE